MSVQATWMSGGSGSGVYDPVTTTDGYPTDVQFSDRNESWFSKGRGRTYKFGTYRDSGVKAVCDEIRNRSRPKCLLLVFAATILLILFLLIIVIVSSGDSGPQLSSQPAQYEEMENDLKTGLHYVPAGFQNTVLIKYSQQKGKEQTYANYTKSLDRAMQRYSTIDLHSHVHRICNSTYNPHDVICQQPLTIFGKSCKGPHHYGYPAGQPCVLLYLNLPQNYTLRALKPDDGDAYVQAERAAGSHNGFTHIPVSCEPAAEDRQYVDLTSTSATGNASIEYHPRKGFPTFFFRPRTVETFIPPAVMVQFRTIKINVASAKPVRFNCRAWGKAMDADGNVVNPDGLFKTSFVFLIQ